jgi:uncharacterized repeat protein (TIGR01451 family)
MLKLRLTSFLAVLLAAFHLSALAAPATVESENTAEREVVTVIDGKREIQRRPVDRAVPGDEIIYTTTFRNLAGLPAKNFVITNPVPNASVYKGGSASGANTVITFSVDGGKRYAAANKLTIKTPEGKTRPALPTDYTHIRWTYRGELGAGKSGEVSFRAFIK